MERDFVLVRDSQFKIEEKVANVCMKSEMGGQCSICGFDYYPLIKYGLLCLF